MAEKYSCERNALRNWGNAQVVAVSVTTTWKTFKVIWQKTASPTCQPSRLPMDSSDHPI